MLKRVGLILLVMLCLCGAAFAQEAEEEAPAAQTESASKKMAASLDLMPLFKGIIASDSDADRIIFDASLSFEYLLREHFSLRGTLDTWFGEIAEDIPFFYFSLVPQGRWYFLSSGLDKFFLGAGIGLNLLTVDGEDPEPEYHGFVGLTVQLQAGYKLILGPGVFVEPSISYVYSKAEPGFTVSPLGWQAGLNVGYAF